MQVGRKDRKPGQYGGCLVQGGEKAYVARPGLRLWSADSTGKVWLIYMYHVINMYILNTANTRRANFGLLCAL